VEVTCTNCSGSQILIVRHEMQVKCYHNAMPNICLLNFESIDRSATTTGVVASRVYNIRFLKSSSTR
jgi:hypothetical protein